MIVVLTTCWMEVVPIGHLVLHLCTVAHSPSWPSTGSCSLSERQTCCDKFELVTLLSLPLESWHLRFVPIYLAYMVLRTKPRLSCILGKLCILTWLCPLQSIRNKWLGTDLWRQEFLYVLLDLVCKKAMFLSSIYDFCFIFILWVMTSLFS